LYNFPCTHTMIHLPSAEHTHLTPLPITKFKFYLLLVTLNKLTFLSFYLNHFYAARSNNQISHNFCAHMLYQIIHHLNVHHHHYYSSIRPSWSLTDTTKEKKLPKFPELFLKNFFLWGDKFIIFWGPYQSSFYSLLATMHGVA